jgi:hypothetical protein
MIEINVRIRPLEFHRHNSNALVQIHAHCSSHWLFIVDPLAPNIADKMAGHVTYMLADTACGNYIVIRGNNFSSF